MLSVIHDGRRDFLDVIALRRLTNFQKHSFEQTIGTFISFIDELLSEMTDELSKLSAFAEGIDEKAKEFALKPIPFKLSFNHSTKCDSKALKNIVAAVN